MATDSSTTPRPAPMCPPVREQTSIRRSRTAVDSSRSSSRDIPFRSAGERTRSRMDIGTRVRRRNMLRTPFHDVAGEALETGGEPAGVAQRRTPVLHLRVRALAGSFYTKQCRIGAFPEGVVAPRGLPDLVASRRYIEEVVGNLEGQADRAAVPVQSLDPIVRSARSH